MFRNITFFIVFLFDQINAASWA